MTNKIKNLFGDDWYSFLQEYLDSPEFYKIGKQIYQLRNSGKKIIPEHNSDLLFKAFRSTPLNNLKVIVMGLDPYHTPGAYDGLAFSNSSLIKPQPSLRNILQEVEWDIYDGFDLGGTSDLSLYRWAKQGVLLINTAHTVEVKKPESHLHLWKPFTEFVIRKLQTKNDLVWLLWGNKAQNFKSLVSNPSQMIIESGHPSPLNTTNPFRGSKPFSRCNEQLKALNKKMISW